MTENGNPTRPVRTLTVKNFSVIKEATLEFGKITVLIGPQASGKSLLCQLAYFLGREVIGIAIACIQNKLSYSEFEEQVKRLFEKWFPPTGWGQNGWSVTFVSDRYSARLSASDSGSALALTLAPELRKSYEVDLGSTDEVGIDIRSTVRSTLLRGLSGKGPWDAFTYIPAERTYFVDTNKGYRSLVSDPDPIVQTFAVFYEDSRVATVPKARIRRHLKGEVRRGEDGWQFAFDDGRVLPLSQLSSGAKELLPLLTVLEAYEQLRPTFLSEAHSRFLRFDDFFIEEPESHIFPDMQRELVRYFTELTNADRLKPHFTITTHSPYILSAFNNLIEASQVAAAKPGLKSEVAKLIPERYWIKPQDFKAYAIEDGVLKSIVAEDTGLVSSNYLDQVSETIGMEFDELLRLGYVES